MMTMGKIDVAAIEAAFPGATGAAGVDRAKLGPMVLGDRAALDTLTTGVYNCGDNLSNN